MTAPEKRGFAAPHPETCGWALAETTAKTGTSIGPAAAIVQLVHRAYDMGRCSAEDVPAMLDGAIRFHTEIVDGLKKTRAAVCAPPDKGAS